MKKLKRGRSRRKTIHVGELSWEFEPSLRLHVERPGATLLVIVSRGPTAWGVFALEAPALDKVTSIADVFDAHAHAVVGTYPTLEKALFEGRRYAKDWKKKGAPAADPCACPEITP